MWFTPCCRSIFSFKETNQFFLPQARCNSNYHLAYTLPIVASSFLFNIPRFFELRTEMVKENCTNLSHEVQMNHTGHCLKLELQPTPLRKDANYNRDYVLIANSLSLVFIPILVLIILNSFIFRTIRKATQRHNAISSHQVRYRFFLFSVNKERWCVGLVHCDRRICSFFSSEKKLINT